MPIAPGETIGPYRVIEQLGSGGMATVYKAYHAALDRYVAIKVLHPAFKSNPQFFERFQREARIVAGLEHPHIIPVYDFNEHEGEPYLVMRFVEGDTLKHRMQGKPIPAAEVLHLIRPVCQALSYAHSKGVLHRDIKPSNIMVGKDGTVFLTDFGLARMVQAGESTLSQDMMVGTPQYISPEQAQGVKELDGRTDIYSLGVVLFEMLTGRVPFAADTPFATIHDHIYTPLPLPSTINPDIDPAVERLLLKALAKEPDDRFATVDELQTALETALGAQIAAAPAAGQPTTAAVPPAKPRKKRPWWLWAGGAALLLLLCAGLLAGLLLWRRANRAASPPVDQPPPAGQVDQPPPQGDRPPPPGDNPPRGDQSPPGQANPPAQGDQPPPQGDKPSPPDPAATQKAAQLTQEATRALQQKDFDKAMDLFNQAIETDPHFLPAYFGLSEAQRLSGHPDEAVATLEQAVAENPDNPLAYQRLAEAYLLTDRPEEALPVLEEAAQLAPDNPEIKAEQGIALLALDEDDAAREAIDAALALDPLNPYARLADAFYQFKHREFGQARQTLRQILADARTPYFVRERAQRLLDRIGSRN